jgi:hypothetical protein
MGTPEQQITRWLREDKKEFCEYLRTTEDWIGMSEKKLTRWVLQNNINMYRWVYQNNSWIEGYVTEQQLTGYMRQDNFHGQVVWNNS